LTGLVDKIKPAVIKTFQDLEGDCEKPYSPEVLEAVAKRNVACVVEAIPQESDILQKMINKGQVAIVGAMYYVESGIVEFNQV
ncbi:MAG: carbonic anhydrase, partial [Flavobacteriales bacterium]|nr:carbonic anhydrase [Flavobacteriales bacterium]